MRNKIKNNGGGFIQAILIVIGALVILKYAYKIDIVGLLTTGSFKMWLDKFYSLALSGWDRYDWLVVKAWDYSIGFIKGLLYR